MEYQMLINSERPRLHIETVGDVTVIGFEAPTLLAEENVREIAERLCVIAERPGPAKLLLDFRLVHAMSGRMLAILIWIARKIERGGGGCEAVRHHPAPA
jgi:hypothetical protein